SRSLSAPTVKRVEINFLCETVWRSLHTQITRSIAERSTASSTQASAAKQQSVIQIHQDNEQAICQFKPQVSAFEERMETARKDSDSDRLTSIASRRDAEHYWQRMASREKATDQVQDLFTKVSKTSVRNAIHAVVMCSIMISSALRRS